ncbi:hypothetical protein ACFQAT_23785 [Undibacterium arcticum]|uniref:Ribulose-phosphate 3-epimerase n=1 Tax=Undibacterium arcticum TaxID=1762892 RepID=A0ABV7EZV0_9BURK
MPLKPPEPTWCIGAIRRAGADTLVAGSAMFGAPEADQGYRTIMQKLREQAAPR